MSDRYENALRVGNFQGETLRWLPLNGTLTVGDRTISRGLFYFGTGSMSYKAHPAASFRVEIDTKRSHRVENASFQSLSKLSYVQMSREEKELHLEWLASGRNDPRYSVNAVWNYFLGLETRATIDAVADPAAKAELDTICAEVESLRSVYGEQEFFFKYQTTALLNYLSVPANNPNLYLESPPPAAAPGAEFMSKLALSQAYSDGHPLPADWLLSWYYADSHFKKHENIIANYRGYFETLFKAELPHRYPQGIENKVKADAAKKFEVYYHPSKGYIDRVVRNDAAFNLPDVTYSGAGLARALTAIATKVYDRMRAFHARTQRPGLQGKVTEAAILLRYPWWDAAARERFTQIAASVREKGAEPVIERMSALFHPTPVPADLSRSVFVSVATELAEYFGLGLEPHPDFGEALATAETSMAVFPVGKKAPKIASAEYLRRAAAVWFYALVVRASGVAPQGAVDDALRLISTFHDVGRPGQSRLGALLLYHLAQPYSLKGLQTRVRALGEDGAKSIVADLVRLGAHAGRSNVDTMRMLEKLCEALGQPSELLYSLAHAGGPPTPARAKAKRKTTASQGMANGAPTPALPVDHFELDADTLKRLRKETAAVGKTLKGIFVDDEPPLPVVQRIADNPVADGDPNSLMGLDGSHSAMLARLIEKSRWERDEVEALCRELQLMTDAALERINDAAFDNFGQALLEGDDTIDINQDLVREMATR